MHFTDLIFKNQAMDQKSQNQGNFVNDLLRTEFHKYVFALSGPDLHSSHCRKFMAKFIKVSLTPVATPPY